LLKSSIPTASPLGQSTLFNDIVKQNMNCCPKQGSKDCPLGDSLYDVGAKKKKKDIVKGRTTSNLVTIELSHIKT
jgi:hypothetical protein